MVNLMGKSKGISPAAVPVAQDAEKDAKKAVPTTSMASPVTLLVGRLNAWKHVVNDLISFYSDAAKVHKGTAASYEKVASKSISVPLRDAEYFGPPNEGGSPATLMTTLQQSTLKLASEYNGLGSTLRNGVLSHLEKIKAEIKSKQKDLDSVSGKEEKTVERARQETEKLIESLEHHTSAVESSKMKQDAKFDPYILRRHIVSSLNRQVEEENKLQDHTLAMQKDYVNFEAHIISSIKEAISLFDAQVSQREAQMLREWSSSISSVASNASANPTRDWQSFASRERGKLPDPNAPKRQVENIAFPGQDTPSAKPIRQGFLQRKGKVLSRYDTFCYVLTPAGYLHEFKNEDEKAEAEPSTSIYIPEATIGAHSAGGAGLAGSKHSKSSKDENKFNIAAKGGAFNTKHEYVFKAGSPEECVAWWEALRIASGQPIGSERAKDTDNESSPTSPVTAQSGFGQQNTAGAQHAASQQAAQQQATRQNITTTQFNTPGEKTTGSQSRTHHEPAAAVVTSPNPHGNEQRQYATQQAQSGTVQDQSIAQHDYGRQQADPTIANSSQGVASGQNIPANGRAVEPQYPYNPEQSTIPGQSHGISSGQNIPGNSLAQSTYPQQTEQPAIPGQSHGLPAAHGGPSTAQTGVHAQDRQL